MKTLRSTWVLIAMLAATGCSEVGQRRVSIPLELAGQGVTAPWRERGGAAVTLERAELAFGPLYLCAGEQAGELCETARAEWLESAVVELLDETPQPAGELAAVTGPVRSYMYDLGLSSVLTHEEPLTLPAAEQLGGVSLLLEGQAELAAGSTRFAVRLVVAQSGDTELGVPVVRSSAQSGFEHEIEPDEPGLRLRFALQPLIAGVDLEEACAGQTECGELSEQTQAIRSLRQALSGGARPSFEWARDETDR